MFKYVFTLFYEHKHAKVTIFTANKDLYGRRKKTKTSCSSFA